MNMRNISAELIAFEYRPNGSLREKKMKQNKNGRHNTVRENFILFLLACNESDGKEKYNAYLISLAGTLFVFDIYVWAV